MTAYTDSPRFRADLDRWATRGPTTLAPSDCCGCGAASDPDGLCDLCTERRAEYGEHSCECFCDGCRWYRATGSALRARGAL